MPTVKKMNTKIIELTHETKKDGVIIKTTKSCSLTLCHGEIQELHTALGVDMASHSDAIEGRAAKGTEWELLIPEGVQGYYREGEDPNHMFYMDENGEEKFVDTCYVRNPDHNNNDYIMLDIEGREYPIDWMIVNLLETLIESGIRTQGSEQGDPEMVETDYGLPYEECDCGCWPGYIILQSPNDAKRLKTLFENNGLTIEWA